MGGPDDLNARRRVEEDLARRPEFTRQLMDASPAFIVAIGADGRTLTMNPALLEALEYTLDQVQGKDYIANFVPERDRPQVRELFGRIIHSREATTNENWIVAKSGREILVEWRGRPVVGADGRLDYFVGIGIDITERQRMERALRKSEEKFVKAFLHARGASFICDEQGRILDVNLAFEDRTGYTHGEAIGRTIEELGLWRDSREYAIAARVRRSEGLVCDFEFESRRKTGEIWTALFSSMPMDIEGKPGTISVFVDISKIKDAEKELKRSIASLQESESRFRTLFDLVPFSMAVHDTNGQLRDGNASFCAACGMRPEELAGRYTSDFFDLHRTGDREQDIILDRKTLEEAQHRPVELNVLHRVGGRKRIVLLSAAAITLDGKPSIVTCAINVTELRAVEQQLRQSQKMDAIGRLASGIAHDFNNLLTVIGGYTRLALTKMPDDGPLRHYISEVSKAVTHAESLTRHLLAFCRNQALRPAVTDLNVLIRESSRLLDHLLGSNVVLALSLSEGLPPVRVDSGQIVQVIMNLAVNARDAMPSGGRLDIKTSMAGDSVGLQISDTGIGMDAETLSHMFEPFFTTKPEGQGTGLGLSTVYGIVKQSGGAISVQSQPGSGSTFEVLLPSASFREQQRELSKRNIVSPGSKTVLVVEDNEAIAAYVAMVLEQAGYQLLKAATAPEALAIAESHPVNLLITDLTLRGLGGRELAQSVRALRPQIAIVYMSGYANPGTIEALLKEADATYLQKPFSPDALLEAARQAIDPPPEN